MFIAIHLFVTTLIAFAFAFKFGHAPSTVASHLVLVAEWDLLLLMLWRAVRWRRAVPVALFSATFAAQTWLYVLDAIGYGSWGRTVTWRLVSAFAPVMWSGKEPFPVGRPGIVLFLGGPLVAMLFVAARWLVQPARPASRLRAVAGAIAAGAAFAATLSWGIADRDRRAWKDELFASFFRPVGYAFEPTARREAVAERDAALRAAYPRAVPGARRANVVLIIVDSLRADRMQVYGYPRETTPFLASAVRSGRMKKVEAAFSTCSESFCGITSTLASREFRDISARTYQLQDVLRDEGYRTWFLLSGNHSVWNGLPQFYHATDDALFDGSRTERYTMDDDRVVLEGLERVPAAGDQPAFFYLHLMSTHYLGVQLPDSHVFTRADDRVAPGDEPYSILPELEKPDRYDDKVRQADGIIRQIFDALRAKGYLDRAIVVITGDHGEGLGERHWAHGWHLYNEDVRIPLLIDDEPSSATYPDLSFAAQVDIAPTILDRLGLPIPPSWEGESLVSPSRTRFTYHQTYFLPNRFAVLYRDDRALFKFIATPQYGKEELYDLRRDRDEARNLVDERPALAALLREKVREYRADDR